MPTNPRLFTPDERPTANRLLDVLQRERIADGAAAADPSAGISHTRARPRPHAVLRVAHAIMALIGQETARTNAAGASASLRKRRHEREEVDTYLRALHSPIAADTR